MSLSHLYQTNIKNKHGKKKCMIYIDLVLNQWHTKDSFLHFSDVQIQIASKNKRNVNKLLYLLQYKVDKIRSYHALNNALKQSIIVAALGVRNHGG